MALENKILVKVVDSSYMAWRCIKSSKTLLGKLAIQSLFVLEEEWKMLKKSIKNCIFRLDIIFGRGILLNQWSHKYKSELKSYLGYPF